MAKELKSNVAPLKKPPRPDKSISPREMAYFQRFLERWVLDHCIDKLGQKWPQRAIAEKLGITQNELSAWMNDKARPGIARLVKLRAATGTSIDEMLGLSSRSEEP